MSHKISLNRGKNKKQKVFMIWLLGTVENLEALESGGPAFAAWGSLHAGRVILGILFNHPKPQLPCLSNGENNSKEHISHKKEPDK